MSERVTGDCRKLHSEELHDLYCSADFIKAITSRRMRWVVHVARWNRKLSTRFSRCSVTEHVCVMASTNRVVCKIQNCLVQGHFDVCMSRETNEQLRDHTDMVCSPSETRNRESKCAHWALVIHPREGLTETHAPFGSPVDTAR